MKISKETIKSALIIAIKSQQDFERDELHYTSDSAFLATIKQAQQALKDGESLEIVLPSH